MADRERFDHYQNALTDIIEKASRQAIEYARENGIRHPRAYRELIEKGLEATDAD